ncbi:MAG: hypothetical protein ACREPM_06295 [Gemmatimonadaceae bacterium]
MDTRGRTSLVLLAVAGIAACTDRVVGPSPDVPVAASYPSVPSSYSETAASASDSRIPTIAVVGDSVIVLMVVPTICGRDTVMAGAARDSLVITLRRTMLPLPCAILLPDTRLRVAARALSPPRVVVVSVYTLDFTDTTRVLVASAVVGSGPVVQRAGIAPAASWPRMESPGARRYTRVTPPFVAR